MNVTTNLSKMTQEIFAQAAIVTRFTLSPLYNYTSEIGDIWNRIKENNSRLMIVVENGRPSSVFYKKRSYEIDKNASFMYRGRLDSLLREKAIECHDMHNGTHAYLFNVTKG